MKALLELEHVSKRFVQPLDVAGKIARALGADVSDEVVHAVDDVSFSVNEGEVVGLVGESGCGKSTLGRMVAGILPPSAGTIRYRGRDRIGLQVQMIFQDPFASLNPRMRVQDIVGEAPVVHGLVKKEALGDYLDQLFARCGLDPSYKKRFPHQFSGGQRSRIGIARALAVKPEFLVCDEAVAALDVSIQAQILNLFMKLREDLALTYLFISHDLGVVEHLSDRVVIMYLGRVIESAAHEEIFESGEPPVYPGAAEAGAAPRHAQDAVQADRRRDPFAAVPADRLPLPPALPVRDGALQGSRAAAEGSRLRPPLGLPPQRSLVLLLLAQLGDSFLRDDHERAVRELLDVKRQVIGVFAFPHLVPELAFGFGGLGGLGRARPLATW